MEFVYIKNSKINREKWNRAISQSLFPMTYGYSWYLDSVTMFWDAIVADDYELVFPLPYRIKFNNVIVYQPLLMPKSAYYYSSILTKGETDNLFEFLKKNVHQFEIILNKFNNCDCSYASQVEYSSLDLYKSYKELSSKYSTYLKSLLFERQNGYIVSGISPNEVIEFLNSLNYFVDVLLYDSLRMLLSTTTIRRLSRIYGYYSKRNELLGLAIFIFSGYSVDLLVVEAVDDNEYIISALIDRFIKDNSGKTYTLNFDNTVSEEVTKLYSEFGTKIYHNTRVFYKNSPKFFRLLKKKK
jgi:hypothetical protein